MPGERTLNFSDLSEFEIKHMQKRADDAGDHLVDYTDDSKQAVVVRDEIAEAVKADPRTGVETQGMQMTDEVAAILEKPFQEDTVEKETEPKEEKAEKDKPIEPDPADVRNFLRCMLGNKRFTKEYEFFGGALKIRLGTRTHAQDEDCVFSVGHIEPVRAMVQLQNMRIAYSLIELRTGDSLQTFEDITPGSKERLEPVADLADAAMNAGGNEILKIEKRIHLLKQLPQAVHAPIASSMREFDTLITVLSQRAADPKLWATDSAG